MAAISKELADALNSLREAIEFAETELAKIPCAEFGFATTILEPDEHGNKSCMLLTYIPEIFFATTSLATKNARTKGSRMNLLRHVKGLLSIKITSGTLLDVVCFLLAFMVLIVASSWLSYRKGYEDCKRDLTDSRMVGLTNP